jgi:hypothetical protein
MYPYSNFSRDIKVSDGEGEWVDEDAHGDDGDAHQHDNERICVKSFFLSITYKTNHFLW